MKHIIPLDKSITLKENFLTFVLPLPHEKTGKMNGEAEIQEQAILACARSWDLRMGIFIPRGHPTTLKSE